MTSTSELLPAAYRDLLDRCLKCGLCREVCPAFRALGNERFSPRGRLALLEATLAGEDFGAPFREALDYCLACRACAERCPSGVAADVLVLAARSAGLCRGGLPFFKSWAFRFALPRPRRMVALTRAINLTRRFGVLPAVLRALGLPGRMGMPKLERAPFASADAPMEFPASPGVGNRGRVSYFVGCAANYFYPTTARAVVALLTRAGHDVVVPTARRCCGVPALANGDWALARQLATANVAALAGDEPIAVDCGSCGLALTFYYDDVLRIPGAAALRSRVRDFTQLVSLETVAPAAGRIAYHDACHLARGLGVKQEPRRLLARRGEVVEIETAGAVTCCGGAGVYGLTHAAIARAVGDERAAAIVATGAAEVAAGCSACVFYLNEALARQSATARARHTAEVLAGP